MPTVASVVAGIGILAAGAAYAGQWPDRLVRVIVPYGPGGGVDSFTRPIAAQLAEQTGQQFLIENRAGAGGTIGVQAAARSAADGYTVLSGGVHQPMAESLYPARGYDMNRDFVPIAITAVVPNVLVVNSNVTLAGVPELIVYARANPDKLTYCSSGNGTSQHVIAEMFKMATKLSILHVPHKGTAAAMITFLGGNCDMMFDGMGTSAPQIRAGKLRPLAVTTAKRSPLFPNVPTLQEAGGPAMDAGTWYGLWAPTGTPQETVRRMHHEVTKALFAPAVKENWKAQGAELSPIPFEELPEYVRSEVTHWTNTNRRAGIRLD